MLPTAALRARNCRGGLMWRNRRDFVRAVAMLIIIAGSLAAIAAVLLIRNSEPPQEVARGPASSANSVAGGVISPNNIGTANVPSEQVASRSSIQPERESHGNS